MDLFPTRIYVHQCIFGEYKDLMHEGEFLARKIAENGYKKHPGWERDTHSLSDPTFSENILKKHRCYKLVEKIQKCATEYVYQLGHTTQSVTGFDITASWLTNTAPGEYARLHDHGTSDLSGVFYIKSDPNKSGSLYFKDHEPVRSATELYKNMSSQQDIPAQQGAIVLFPGWLSHGTRINNSDEDRISLSFNINLITK